MPIDYAKELNEQQLAAVQAEPGPVLVIAGAGSGKTRTLTYRVAYLLEQGVSPDRLLLLTFTNKAAREMLGRVGLLMPLDSSLIWGGTFHSVANRLLRRHASMLGYQSNYAIMDRDDARDVINACIPAAGIQVKDKRFPKGDVLVEIFSLAVNTGRSIDEVVRQQYAHFSEQIESIRAVQQHYVKRKKLNNSMDYDDLLSNLLCLFKSHPDVADVYGRQFQSVLVDEYQDTNRVQSEIVDCFVKGHRNVMVVGDDAQSIYSWRGANFANIMDFPKRYAGAKVFKIEFNYRSTPQILDLANHSISANVRQFAKNLAAVKPGGLKPRIMPAMNTSTQAAFVAAQLLELRDQGIPLAGMAVLYRSHFHSMELQMELTRRNIPFDITSGLRFFEQAHIKDVTAYVKLAINPMDEMAFRRIVLRMPKVGGATAAKLWGKRVDLRETAAAQFPDQPMACLKLLAGDAPKPARDEWNRFAMLMQQLAAPSVVNKPAELIRLAMEAGYEDYLKSQYENYASRREDLDQLALYAQRFEKTEDFLADLALMTEVDVDAGRSMSESPDEVVRLSTVHQAKGQEFRVVFVIWLADGAFPNARAIESIDGEEEERRLFYVAVTRAKDELYLVYPQLRLSGNYGDAFQRPSRFLKELPAHLYEKMETGEEY
ncbi:MAG: ATP-dependent helicase [Verrucomicrobiae bacterium]|nr:ATP-dependent helicase [Verrucomicrobiae bacterium]